MPGLGAGSFRSRLVGMVVLGSLIAGTASGHLKILEVQPEDGAVLTVAPADLRMQLSQEPDPVVSKLELEGPDGAVELGELVAEGKELRISVKGRVVPGDYTVSWRTAGDDGHVQKGRWSFRLEAAGFRAANP